MSPTDRPEGEYRRAQPEGTSVAGPVVSPLPRAGTARVGVDAAPGAGDRTSSLAGTASGGRIATAARVVLVIAFFSLPVSTALTNVAFACFVVLWLFAGHLRERVAVGLSYPISKASLLLYALFLLGVLWSSATSEMIVHQLGAYRKLLFIPLILSMLDSEDWTRRCLWAVYLALALTLLLVFADAVHPLTFSRATREIHTANPFLTGNHYIFKHHITQNVLLSFFVLMNLVLVVYSSSRLYRAAGLACAALGAFAILFLAQGRTGYLTLAAALGVGLFAARRQRKLFYLVLGTAAVSVALAAASPSFHSRVRKVYEQLQLFESGHQLTSGQGIRLEFWRISVQMMEDKPILGWGTGGYNQEYHQRAQRHHLGYVSAGTYNPHNQYLYIGTQLGVVGLLAFVAWLVAPVVWAHALDPPRRTLTVGLLAILAIHSMFDSPLFIVTEGHFYCAMLALLFARPRARFAGPPVAAAS
ncbi:MAG: hypothetical protein LKCHEGNO_00669 [Burkholderiaceae bacterium]|nr:hypothetical protein [Burkholderiaceae bacterium]